MGSKPDDLAPEDDAKAQIPIVLVGLMGAGKSCVGRRLAEKMNLPFKDSDQEVEKAAGCSVTDIFDVYGEPAFRDCERRVIQRLLDEGAAVIATGGGAFMNADTRNAVKGAGVSVWLRATPDTLYQRTKRSKDRPLLKTEDPLGTLVELANARYPTYGEADIIIDTDGQSLDETVQRVLQTLHEPETASA